MQGDRGPLSLCNSVFLFCDANFRLSLRNLAQSFLARSRLCVSARLCPWETNLEGRPHTENAYTELTYTKTGFHGHKALSRTHRRFHVHTGVFTIFMFCHVHSWFFHVHLHTFSRTYFGFRVHLLFSRPHLVFTYTPPFSSSFGQTDFGRIFRVQMVPQERMARSHFIASALLFAWQWSTLDSALAFRRARSLILWWPVAIIKVITLVIRLLWERTYN